MLEAVTLVKRKSTVETTMSMLVTVHSSVDCSTQTGERVSSDSATG